jgi:hypothetical protein
MTVQQQVIEEGLAPCRDPECAGVAEVEVDGDHRYFECMECGFCFGYERISVSTDETCAIGVPEDLRRSASAPMEQAQMDRFRLAVTQRGQHDHQ